MKTFHSSNCSFIVFRIPLAGAYPMASGCHKHRMPRIAAFCVYNLLLLQILDKEFCNACKEVETSVATVINTVVAVGVNSCLILLACLIQCVNVAYHIANVNIIVGCTVNEQ